MKPVLGLLVFLALAGAGASYWIYTESGPGDAASGCPAATAEKPSCCSAAEQAPSCCQETAPCCEAPSRCNLAKPADAEAAGEASAPKPAETAKPAEQP
jgi:hypothetical protein